MPCVTLLRITNYKKRAVIAFAVDAELVSIIGIFYGGQDYETTQNIHCGLRGADRQPSQNQHADSYTLR